MCALDPPSPGGLPVALRTEGTCGAQPGQACSSRYSRGVTSPSLSGSWAPDAFSSAASPLPALPHPGFVGAADVGPRQSREDCPGQRCSSCEAVRPGGHPPPGSAAPLAVSLASLPLQGRVPAAAPRFPLISCYFSHCLFPGDRKRPPALVWCALYEARTCHRPDLALPLARRSAELQDPYRPHPRL